MKNYLFYNELQRAQAFLILHGHYYAEAVNGKLYLNTWNPRLTDSVEVALHPDDGTHFAGEFTLRFGKDIHSGNFAELLGDLHDLDELAALYRVGLIDAPGMYHNESEYK